MCSPISLKNTPRDVRDVVTSKGSDNVSQLATYTLQTVGTTDFSHGKMTYVATPAKVPYGTACYMVAAPALFAISLAIGTALVSQGLELYRDLQKTVDLDHLKKLKSELFLCVGNIVNIAFQALSSLLQFIGGCINAKVDLTPSPTFTSNPLANTIASFALISSIIGVVLGVITTTQVVYRMIKNRTQAPTPLRELEWARLKTSLVSQLTLLASSTLGLVLNFLSGGAFEIISWITIGLILISGASSAYNRLALKPKMAAATHQASPRPLESASTPRRLKYRRHMRKWARHPLSINAATKRPHYSHRSPKSGSPKMRAFVKRHLSLPVSLAAATHVRLKTRRLQPRLPAPV